MKRLLSNPSKLLFAAALFNASCGAAGWANLTAHAQNSPRRPARKAAPAEQKSSHAQPLAAGLTEGIAA
ncbi:MAG TPA: hypothetical protein VD835_03235, partial [Pyrinomonadaceae bacterium]|nr:hypothetical protein [Pyrinomonadaceae bacterium]